VWIRSCDEWDTGEAVKKQSQFGSSRVKNGCTNKPNFRRSFKCKVSSVKLEKSMAGLSDFKLYTSHFKLGRRPLVRNKANRSIADCGFGGAAACHPGPARTGCTNKPNSAESRPGSPYKQTQFTPAGWAGEAVAGAYCAKQTQLPEAGHRGGVSIADCGLGTDLRRDALCEPPGQGPVVQTKPIGRDELRQTNPILATARRRVSGL